MTDQDAFRIAFVAGVSPDKWVRRWRERTPDSPLELDLVDDADQRTVLEDGRAAMSFVRLPVERDGLHLIPLYVEVPVVVLPKEHELTLLDELTLDDLAGEQLVTDPADLPGFAEVTTVERLAWPAMGPRDAVEVVASGGAVAVLPMSVARLHHRKDVTTRPLVDGPESAVGLAWLRDNDDPRIDTFVGIVRGRTAQSSRGAEGDAAAPKPVPRTTPRTTRTGKGSGARRTSTSKKRRGR
jgi:DNA-binding transcriptional LysR family regulator